MNKINETLREAKHWKDLPKNMEEKLDDIFQYTDFNCGPDLDIHTPRKSSESNENDEEPEKETQVLKENKEKEANGENNKSVSDSYESELDVMSGIWNMFNTNENLICTTPNYDAYRQQSPHWMDRESVPWEDFDKARFKCVNWMQSNEEQI